MIDLDSNDTRRRQYHQVEHKLHQMDLFASLLKAYFPLWAFLGLEVKFWIENKLQPFLKICHFWERVNFTCSLDSWEKGWPKSTLISRFRFNPFSKFQPFFTFFRVLTYNKPYGEVRFSKAVAVLKIKKIWSVIKKWT